MLLVELVLKLPLLGGDPTLISDADWLLVGISCPCGDKSDFVFTLNDIWVWPCGGLDGCWGKFLTAETLVAGEAGVLAEFFHGIDCAAVLLKGKVCGNIAALLENLAALENEGMVLVV